MQVSSWAVAPFHAVAVGNFHQPSYWIDEEGHGSMNDFDLTPPTDEQFRQLAAELGDDERKVLLEHGTEAPFCGTFLHEKREGVFSCRLCGLPLFGGGTKFESGTGWPSFAAPFADEHLHYVQDSSYGMVRTE